VQLTAHWLILASLTAYFSERRVFPLRNLVVLAIVALTIELYLTAMVVSICLARLAREYLSSESQSNRHSVLLKSTVQLVTSVMAAGWLLGYTTLSDNAIGVGFFRSTLLGFLKPGASAEHTFSSFSNLPGNDLRVEFLTDTGESYLYLGLAGVIGLAAIVVTARKSMRNLSLAPILVVATLAFLAALSNQIAIPGGDLIVPSPAWLTESRQIFRAAPRFAWIPYYLLIALGWRAINFVNQNYRLLRLFVVGISVVGILDQATGVGFVRDHFVRGQIRPTALQSPSWELLAKRAEKMYLVPTFDVQDDSRQLGADFWRHSDKWVDLIEFGAKHDLITNFAYLGRPVSEYVRVSNASLQAEFNSGQLPNNSILFFAYESDWRKIIPMLGSGDRALILDGLPIIATDGKKSP